MRLLAQIEGERDQLLACREVHAPDHAALGRRHACKQRVGSYRRGNERGRPLADPLLVGTGAQVRGSPAERRIGGGLRIGAPDLRNGGEPCQDNEGTSRDAAHDPEKTRSHIRPMHFRLVYSGRLALPAAATDVTQVFGLPPLARSHHARTRTDQLRQCRACLGALASALFLLTGQRIAIATPVGLSPPVRCIHSRPDAR